VIKLLELGVKMEFRLLQVDTKTSDIYFYPKDEKGQNLVFKIVHDLNILGFGEYHGDAHQLTFHNGTFKIISWIDEGRHIIDLAEVSCLVFKPSW
jgi:hypothetical protein